MGSLLGTNKKYAKMTNIELEKELKERGYAVTRIVHSFEREIDFLIVSVTEIENSSWSL
jgi:hypothetical protein